MARRMAMQSRVVLSKSLARTNQGPLTPGHNEQGEMEQHKCRNIIGFIVLSASSTRTGIATSKSAQNAGQI